MRVGRDPTAQTKRNPIPRAPAGLLHEPAESNGGVAERASDVTGAIRVTDLICFVRTCR